MNIEEKELLLWTYKTIIDYLEKLDNPQQKITNAISISDLKTKLNLIIPNNIEDCGKAFTNFCNSMQLFLDHSVLSGHRHFFNQLYGELQIPALAAEFLSTLNNSSMATYEMTPIATLIEKKLIEKFAEMIWSKDKHKLAAGSVTEADGLLVLGGSYANMMALLCARNYLFPKFKEDGFCTIKNQLKVFISEEAHYSFFRAANILGIGHKNVVKVASDENGKMRVDELEKAILQSITVGDRPFFVAATFGTTVTGSIDSFNKIYEIANKYGLWFHVDGAFLGPLLINPSRFFSKEQNEDILKGIEFADSFSLDAHKLMGVPLTCSAIMLKEGSILRDAISGGEGDYLFHTQSPDDFQSDNNNNNNNNNDNDNDNDIGKYSLQCGRKIDSLKLWGLWQYFGDEGIAKRFSKLISLIEYAEECIKKNDNLELIVPRQSLILLFRYNNNNTDSCSIECNVDNLKIQNDINYHIRQKIISEGHFMINYAIWKGKLALRLVILNQNTASEDLDKLFQLIISLGKEISKKAIST
ncbi:MAG: aminotransferase class V-fold PLP-dependent enzyme [Oligoflexia bacterium]|nr:aminotransferase class V-fold PLP-dependent enzyme [Oligoflexia bacterium]